ncbi:MAG TPA: hypothetical protein VM054_05035 [bacterium]|nr:hypothetical protein [bacterium]
MKLFDFGKGIEFGQRLFIFCVLAGLFVVILALYVFRLIDEGLAIAGWTGLCGVGGGGVIVRGIQDAAREKANSTVEIGEAKDAIGFKLEDDA